MLIAYGLVSGHLRPIAPTAALRDAVWIDLMQPSDAEAADVAALGVSIPTLAEMEEIEISNRLYREGGADYMTVVLPAISTTKTPTAGPVTFVLAASHLITVRHHVPRPFETYPQRANQSAAGCETPERVFLGLIEEIIARIADLMEGAGRGLDETARLVFGGDAGTKPAKLRQSLESIGREGELLGRLGLSLLTLERALSYFGQTLAGRPEHQNLKDVVEGQMRDIQALGVHAEFLSNRVSLATDATLGMINLAQNATVRIVSVVAALFLPPTLIASVYGMNFARMPELQTAWGYPGAVLLMILSAAATYLYFKWKGWL